MSSQQRDCPGFAPDSLFSSAGLKGLSHRPGGTKRCKVIKKNQYPEAFSLIYIKKKGI